MAAAMFFLEVRFWIKDFDSEDAPLFFVDSFSGEEEIGALFFFDLFLSTKKDIPFAKVMGKKATLALLRKDQNGNLVSERYVNGIVGLFVRQRREAGLGYTVYHARIVPSATRLDQRVTSRIFQEKNTEEIVDAVFAEWHKDAKTHTFAVHPDPVARDYCVQYGESDWKFISRLLEEEGYYSFFEHGKDDHSLTIINGKNYQSPIDDASGQASSSWKGGKVPFFPRTGQNPDVEHIYGISFRGTVVPGQVYLDEYFFQLPEVELQAVRTASPESSYKNHTTVDEKIERHSYPSLFEPKESAIGQSSSLIDAVAKIRLQEARAGAIVGTGESTCIRLEPGRFFTLVEESSSLGELARVEEEFDGKEYLVTRVRHEGRGGEGDRAGSGQASRCHYSNSFDCVPRDIPFRPQRRTQKPVIQGVQSALVVGPEGEDVWVDKLGRVKLLFRWDRKGRKKKKEKESLEWASCWVRVSQLWAGQGWGGLWIPRVGHEVLVSFEEGDPDRPIITGRVYNPRNPPPVELPKEKSKSTIRSNSSPDDHGRRSNEIRFEDKKGAEQIYVHAQLDLDEVVGHDHTRKVKHDETITIEEGNRRVTVEKGNQTVSVKETEEETYGTQYVTVDSGDRVIKVEAGNQQLYVKAQNTVTVDGSEERTVGGECQEAVKGSYSLEVGEAGMGCTLTLTPQGEVELKCPHGSITMDASGITIKSTGKLTLIGVPDVDIN